MKRLLLVRHAKSSWKTAAGDFERPLNERGVMDAPLMGVRLQHFAAPADLIVTSPARRARMTAELLAAALHYDAAAIVEAEEIYQAGLEDLQGVVRRLDDAFSTVLLVGHNPGITNFANWLCGAGIDSMPTAAAAVVELAVESWCEAGRNKGSLVDFDYPKRRAAGP